MTQQNSQNPYDSVRRPRKGNLFASFRFSFQGLLWAACAERNLRLHFIVALTVILLGAWLRVSLIEWLPLFGVIALVLISEMMNTIVELFVDMVTQERSPAAKCVKDVAAGAVLIAAVTAAIAGFAVLGPPLWGKISLLWK
ncbi:MAG: hypothetical protein A2Y73_05885 [Chloroflexi bacterium RBG_13_56_8]|nr:MAG: hypothetical protein A2Y73_05885 [Chloroflexi bacterium RBG_13_56_8]